MAEPIIEYPKIKHVEFPHIKLVKLSSGYIKRNQQKHVIVEEKIDGSNLYFATNGNDIVCGKKTSTLGDNAIFYGFQKIIHLKENMLQLYQKLNIKNVTIYLYGELIPTQKRIRYIKDGCAGFIVYNLGYIPFDQEASENTMVWMPKQDWNIIVSSCGFIVNPTIREGTLEECIQFDVENTKSIIPKLIDQNTQIVSPMEGVVIKGVGFIVKKKADAFREMEIGGHNKIQLNINKDTKIDPLETELCNLLTPMLTYARVDNIVSKIGETLAHDALRLSNTVVLDAIKEAKDDEESIMHKASKSKIGKVQKALAIVFTDTVKNYMKW